MKNNKIFIKVFMSLFAILFILGGLIASLNYFSRREEEILYASTPSNLYNVTIDLNGASKVAKPSVKCYSNDDYCLVTLPLATRDDGEVLGYSLDKEATEPTYLMNETIKINDNMKLYVVSYTKYQLRIDAKNVDYLETDRLSCNIYNKEESCEVLIPLYNKIGYENKGYSTSRESLSGYIYGGENYSLSHDTVLYPIYSYSSRLMPINVSKTMIIKNTFVEVESTCSIDIFNRYLAYLQEIEKEMPILLIGNKISFLGDNLFTQIWGSNYAGMNFGPKSLRSVDIRCSDIPNNDYYATIVHEMAHTWDFYYAQKIGANITSQNDIINLYNKYTKLVNRPFRNYSYSNIYEFFADIVKYYYFKYKVPKAGYKSLDFPSDIKKTLEKYLCIAIHDYDEKKCR